MGTPGFGTKSRQRAKDGREGRAPPYGHLQPRQLPPTVGFRRGGPRSQFQCWLQPLCNQCPPFPVESFRLEALASVPFATMPYIVRPPKGLQCHLCNGSSDETINSSKWALGTASPSRKRGEAEQHVSHVKHLQAFNAAKLTPSLRHLLPIAAIHPWHRTTISRSKCAICAANLHPPLEWGPWCTGSAPKERHVIDAHAASATHQR